LFRWMDVNCLCRAARGLSSGAIHPEPALCRPRGWAVWRPAQGCDDRRQCGNPHYQAPKRAPQQAFTTTGQTVRVRTVHAQLDPALPGLGLALHILAALPLRGSETGWMPVCRSSGLAGLACGRIQRGANLPQTLAWRRAWQTRSNALQALLVHNSKQPWVFSIDAGQPLPVILARSLAPSRLSVSRITRRAQPPDARSPEPIA